MNATAALITLQFLITMLFVPFNVGARGHASLARNRIEIDLNLFRLPIARLRVKKKDRSFALYINGKQPKGKAISPKQALSALKQYKLEGVKASGNLLALVGTEDAKNSAMLTAALTCIAQPLLKQCKIYTSKPADALEIDGRIRMKINLYQLIAILLAAVSAK